MGNLLLMRLLVEQFRVPLLAANGVAILACSLLNFAVGDRFVFRPMRLVTPAGKRWDEVPEFRDEMLSL